MSFMSFMEVYYVTVQEHDQSEAQARVDLMAALPVLRVESTVALGIVAGELKANHRLSVADAWIAALAKQRNATLAPIRQKNLAMSPQDLYVARRGMKWTVGS